MLFSGYGSAPLLAVACVHAAACGATRTDVLKEFLGARPLDRGLIPLSQ